MKNCVYCNSKNVEIIDSYKHKCIVCNNCCNVFHVKKNKYFLEYFLPRKVFVRILPEKAFLRIFSDRGDFSYSGFYDSYVEEEISNWRLSEWEHVRDTLDFLNIEFRGKSILDVSGGPGFIGSNFMTYGSSCVVTEFSSKSVESMKNRFNLDARKFDYNEDNLVNVVKGEYDLVLLRSSIIFCEDLEKMLLSVHQVLKPNGKVLFESIIPTMGEILWWQTLEYKFPRIPSQEYIEKLFIKCGFFFGGGFREYGSYNLVKRNSYQGFLKNAFVWLVDFPLVLLYRLLNLFKNPSIDNSMNHKMIFQSWIKSDESQKLSRESYNDFKISSERKSFHFGQIYNGYLKKEKR